VDHHTKREIIWGAPAPDHLRDELLGVVPLLGAAQALEQGAVGVRVGGERHAGDEAPRVAEAALAAVTRDKRVVGDDVGGAGRREGRQHPLGVGEPAPRAAVPRDEGVARDSVGGARALGRPEHALGVVEAARGAELLDEEGAGDHGGAVGVPHGLHEEERGVEVPEADEVVQPMVSPAPSRAAPGRARRRARVDPPGVGRRGGQADAGALRLVSRRREGVRGDGSGRMRRRAGGAGGDRWVFHFQRLRAR